MLLVKKSVETRLYKISFFTFLLSSHCLPTKKFLKKSLVQVGMDLQKGQKQGRDEKTQEHYITTEWCRPALWPPMQCACIPSSLCCLQNELGLQVHCVWGQRGGCHHSMVVFIDGLVHTFFVYPCCRPHFFIVLCLYVMAPFLPNSYFKKIFLNLSIQVIDPFLLKIQSFKNFSRIFPLICYTIWLTKHETRLADI